MLASPYGIGLDDPSLNLTMDLNVSGLGCSEILVCVAEKDGLRERGLKYKEVVVKGKLK